MSSTNGTTASCAPSTPMDLIKTIQPAAAQVRSAPHGQARADDFWVLARSASYLRGRGLTFGPPLIQASATQPGVFSLSCGVVPGGERPYAMMDSSFSVIADGSLDHVLVTPQVAILKNPRTLLEEAARKLKRGGHLLLLTHVGPTSMPNAVEFYPNGTRALLAELAHWRIKEDIEHAGKHLLILKKTDGRRGLDVARVRSGAQRVCIARYGALGDALIMTPLVRQLAQDGYEVTLNISSYCAPIFENSPWVHNTIIQERDLIPNHLLGPYWRYWAKEYDRYINLSESIEGDLLLVENRPPFFTRKEWRHAQCNKNYYDYTMQRGGYPDAVGGTPELFFTRAEERWADEFFAAHRGKFILLWALNGSSHHKVYPMMEALLRHWLPLHPDALCITVGDQAAQALEFTHPQLLPMAGRWSIRESLIATQRASCVIGPETMITNAAGCSGVPKIVLLSHSTKENLTKYFLNDFSLEPDVAMAPCWPCHQLHYTKESCPIGTLTDAEGEELGSAPICSMGITPERLLARLDEVVMWQRHRQANQA